MKKHNIYNKPSALAVLLAALLIQGCGVNPNQNPSTDASNSAVETGPVSTGEDLFTDAGPQAEAQIQADSSTSLRSRAVKVNVAALKRTLSSPNRPSTLKLRFFADQEVVIVLEEVQRISDDNIVVVGRIEGDLDSAVTLVVNGDVLVANVKRGTSEESFEVRYHGSYHVVRIPNETAEAEEPCEPVEEAGHSGEAEGATVQSEAAEALDAETQAADTASPLAAPVIDMLIAYTPRAKAAQGGSTAIQALIQMGIADTNRAFIDSGVNLQVRLAGTIETRQNEGTNMYNDLMALRSKTDRRFDEVHAERARKGADQVTLVAAYKGVNTSAGIGFVAANASNAFTVVKAMYFRQYTFSHELGHNIGLNHNDGFLSSSGRFRTIIAYGNYPRIRRYSNPNLKYNGYLTGSSARNEARILNRRAAITASLLSPR